MFQHFIDSWYPSYFLASAILMAILGLLTLKYSKKNKLALYFTFFMFLNVFQSLFSIFEVTATNLETMIWWRNLQQIPLFLTPLLLFMSVMEFIGKRELLRKIIIFVSLPLVIYFILIFTDSIHHLMRTSIDQIKIGQITKVNVQSTQLSRGFIYYNGLLNVLPIILLLINFKHTKSYNRKQSIFLMFIISIILGYAVFSYNFRIDIIDFAALLYIPLGAIIYYGIKKHNLLSIYPIAKDIIVEHIRDGIIVLDFNFRIVDHNKTAKEMLFNYNKTKLTKGAIVTSQEALMIINKYEETGQERFYFSNDANGKLLEYEVHFSHIKNNAENVIGFLIAIYDVTENKRLHRELKNSQRERLELVSNISHDIRNPLTSIVGFSEAMLTGKTVGDTTRIIQYIYDRSRLIQNLVEDLLELTRLETRSIPFELMEIKADEFFGKLMPSIKEDVEANGKIFQFDLDDVAKTYIMIDTKRMEQVMNNLISNALKFTNVGDSISINVARRDSFIVVEVRDTGKGIPEEDLDNIFKRYFTSNDSPVSHGLGLAINKEIIETHNGQIGVESALGEGSTFYFTLPVVD